MNYVIIFIKMNIMLVLLCGVGVGVGLVGLVGGGIGRENYILVILILV